MLYKLFYCLQDCVCVFFFFDILDSPGAVRVYSVTYGRGSGTLRLANVRCAGSETSLLQCTHNGLRDEDCGHTDDIAVICNIRKIQILNLLTC